MEELQKALIELTISISAFLGWDIPHAELVNQPDTKKVEEKIEIINPKQTILVKKDIETAPSEKAEVKSVNTKPETKSSIQKKDEIEKIPEKIATPKQEKNINESLSINERIKRATVNIYCTWIQKNGILKTTGSGIIISENGAVLTNAHVAEHLLLQDFLPKGEMNCSIRNGSPAKVAFKGKVTYLPLSWARENKGIALNFSPQGSGEKDFAIIELDSPQGEAVLRRTTWIDLANDNINLNEKILLSGYPAGFGSSGGNLLEHALYIFLDEVTVTEVFGFEGGEKDAIGTSPTSMAVHGVSGGGVFGADGKLRGIMVATTFDKLSGKPNIRILSLPYIKRTLQKESGKTLEEIIKNIESESENFKKNYGQKIADLLLGK